MRSTETRFWLRFESEAREGERVPVPSGGASIGRADDNDIVLAHSSVSGRHARLEVAGEGLRLVDAGSTNGVRVEGEKVESRALAHGDRLLFGRVAAVFEDARVAGPPPAGARPLRGAEPGAGTDPSAPALEAVRPETLARSGAARSGGWRLAALGVLLVAALAFAAWRLDLVPSLSSGDGVDGDARIPSVPGNLLADPSFESGEAGPWSSAEAGSVSFQVGGAHARSGRAGFGASLAPGEWALARSLELALPGRRRVELRAWSASSGDVLARVGLELLPDAGAERGPAFIAWAPARRAAAGYEETVLAFDTLPGYGRGRVVVAALDLGAAGAAGDGKARGTAAFDDVSVVLTDPAGAPSAAFEEYELRILGAPGSTAALLRSGRVLFSSLALSSWSANGFTGWATAAWDVRSAAKGFELVAAPGAAPAGTRCIVRPYGHRPLERAGSGEPWVVTLGAEGYRAHGLPFERTAASDLLAGDGVNLIRFGFERPLRTTATVDGDETRFAFDFAGQSMLRLQLDFKDERARAFVLAGEARDAERDGRPGEAIRLWTELLDDHPYEANLILEAEERRAGLEQDGLARLEAIRAELERATFFQLTDLYRASRRAALAAARDFAGSDTEAECRALADEIEAALGTFTGRGAGGHEQRLQGVLEALDPASQPRLVRRVQAELGDEEGGD